MSEDAFSPPPAGHDVIVCRVTPWYFRRMGLAAAFLMACGLYFFYDGKFGYVKDNKIVETHEWFEKVYLNSYEMARSSNSLEQWIARNKADGLPTGQNGEPPKWATFAAMKGWPEELPKRHGDAEIAQQFQWGWAMMIGVGIVGMAVLINRNRKLTGDADHMVMPNGREVRYGDVFKVDKRKWEVKALAYVYFRHDGKEGRVTIDDLKYAGADRVLKRVLECFSGELIEKTAAPRTGDTQSASQKTPESPA